MVAASGLVKVLDFGIARVQRPDADATTTQSMMTNAGTIIGTPAYMSPEQVAGKPVDHRSDQFSFGTILYELVTGSNPFQRGTTVQTMTAILEVTPEPPRPRDTWCSCCIVGDHSALSFKRSCRTISNH